MGILRARDFQMYILDMYLHAWNDPVVAHSGMVRSFVHKMGVRLMHSDNYGHTGWNAVNWPHQACKGTPTLLVGSVTKPFRPKSRSNWHLCYPKYWFPDLKLFQEIYSRAGRRVPLVKRSTMLCSPKFTWDGKPFLPHNSQQMLHLNPKIDKFH